MRKDQLLDILVQPHISEKSTILADKHRKIVFRVMKKATKDQIKKAVEEVFKVEVENVTSLVVKGKTRRRGQVAGRRKDWKKAYVTLKQGFDIDFTEFQ
jgi:large subunit ribosomal protein L23